MMNKKELEITLEKNMLDLECSRNLNFYLNSLVLSTTLLSITFSLITLLDLGLGSRAGLTLFTVGSAISAIILIKAYDYHRKYRESFGEIECLLDEVRGFKLE